MFILTVIDDGAHVTHLLTTSGQRQRSNFSRFIRISD